MDHDDEELILPLPTEHEAPINHLSGRRRKTTLVLVVILATMAMGSRGALWNRERILWWYPTYVDAIKLLMKACSPFITVV